MTHSRGGALFALTSIAGRNMWRNTRRTVFCVSAVAIAVFFTIFMQAMIEGMINNIEEVVRVFDTGHVHITSAEYEAQKEYLPAQFPLAYPAGEGAGGGEAIPVSALESMVHGIPGTKAALPRIMTLATLQDSVVKHAFLWGIKAEEETALHSFNLTGKTEGLVEGRFPRPDSNECAIGVRMAEKAGLGIGDRIPLKTVSAQFSDKMWLPVITGIFQFDYLKYDEDAIIVDFARLQRLLVLGEGTQQLFVYTHNPSQSRAIAQDIRALIGEGNLVRNWQDNYIVALMQQSMMIFAVVYLVFLVVASFLIVNTMTMIIHERIKEIGMMGSLGMTRGEIVLVFFFEAVFLSVLGSLAGCLVGGVGTFVFSFFSFDFNALMGGFKEFPASGTLSFAFDPAILLQGFIFGVAISSICTLIPSIKSAFVEPVEALRR